MEDLIGARLIDSAGCYVSSGDAGEMINASSILSRLIKVAGTECDAYASDLFISWKSLIRNVNALEDGGTHLEWFGFRSYGVDHKAFIDCRTDGRRGENKYEGVYSSVYAIEAARVGEEYSLKLYEIYRGGKAA